MVAAAKKIQPLRDTLKTPLRPGFEALTSPARVSMRRRLGVFYHGFWTNRE